jgi:uncharacterized Ntn-hydrolase superfamily protein
MTFSLVGRCERTGAVGAVIASASMAVAARCAAVRAGVGAVCSQSTTDPRLRGELLDAIAGGVPAGDALAALAEHTADVAFRQLVIVDAAGGAASYSGDRALGVATDVHASGAAAAGNLLADTAVPAAMLAAFTGRAGDDLGDRLIAALRAGLAAGGEVSPVRSAGMLVAEAQPWPVTDLRVDWHDDPVGQLAVLWQLWRPQADSYVGRALRPSEMVQLCAANARPWPCPAKASPSGERERAGRHRPVDTRSRPGRQPGHGAGGDPGAGPARLPIGSAARTMAVRLPPRLARC